MIQITGSSEVIANPSNKAVPDQAHEEDITVMQNTGQNTPLNQL